MTNDSPTFDLPLRGVLGRTALRTLLPIALLAGALPLHLPTVRAEAPAVPFEASTETDAPTEAGESRDWWSEDPWTDPKRPFLYYGVREVPEVSEVTKREKPRKTPAPEPAASPKPTDPELRPVSEDPPLASFTTIRALREEQERRLKRAVMRPTSENLTSWLEASDFIQGKAHRFQAAWERTLYAHPQYDWTAAHPTANFAVTLENERAEREKTALLKSLSGHAGLLLAVRADDPLTPAAARSAAAFARAYGWEILVVADRPLRFDGLPPAKPENGILTRLSITHFPTLLLVPNPQSAAQHPALARVREPLRIGTGVLSVEATAERIVKLLAYAAADPLPAERPISADAPLPTRNAGALLWGRSERTPERRAVEAEAPEPSEDRRKDAGKNTETDTMEKDR